MSAGLPRETLRKIKRMSTEELNAYLEQLYIEGFRDGLREGEQEFEDAMIIDEDKARERLGDEAFSRLLEKME